MTHPLSWSFSVYLGPFRSISVYLSLSWSILDYLGLSRTITGFNELSRLSLAISGYLWSSRAISGYLRIYLSSITYQGASVNRREQYIAILNFSSILFFNFFIADTSYRRARSFKNFSQWIDRKSQKDKF